MMVSCSVWRSRPFLSFSSKVSSAGSAMMMIMIADVPAESVILSLEAVFESSCVKIVRVLTEVEESLTVLQFKFDVPILEFSDVVQRLVHN